MPAKFPRFRAGETFGLFGPKGELILDKRAADLFNAAAAEMRRLGNVSATAPLRWVEDKSGRLFSVDMPQVILAKLSGAGATYTFVQQQYDKTANTFSDMTGGRTGTVYESTGKTGLSGKVVLIEYQPDSNDWRFQFVGAGPRSCSALPHCIYDFPATAYVGDGLGTHTMIQNSITDSFASWQTATPAVFTASQAWKYDIPTNTCAEDGTSVYVWYQFTLNCQGGGKFLANFAKLWSSPCCDLTNDGTPGPFASRYSSSATKPFAPFTGEIANGLILYPCGSTVFDFNYPTDRDPLGDCAGQLLPIPGGGGPLSVTF